MIIPPKLFTDARKDYDLCDVEILSKLAIELGLESKPDICKSFERLIDLLGTLQFHSEFTLLHKIIMDKQAEEHSLRPHTTYGAETIAAPPKQTSP